MSMQKSRGTSTPPCPSAGQTRETSQDEITTALGGDTATPLRAMLDHARRVTYAAHEVIYHQGSPATSVTFFTSGLLKLIERENKHTAVSLTPVTALRLPLSAVQRLRMEDPETYIGLVERWHDYLQEADIWITQFSTGPIRGRVARLLSFMAEFNPGSPGGQVQLLTCEEMGSVLGVTSESTSRILAEFKREHILVTGHNQAHEFYDADLSRLQAIAEQA
jgi:CRP/FNR family transcriptional regulator